MIITLTGKAGRLSFNTSTVWAMKVAERAIYLQSHRGGVVSIKYENDAAALEAYNEARDKWDLAERGWEELP
jgi:hypothetical protein